MSFLRQIKARKGIYPLYKEDEEKKKQFYQFALSRESVIKTFEEKQFQLLEFKSTSVLKGLKDEIKFLKTPLQQIYDSRSPAALVIHKIINMLFKGFSGHMTFYVFKKL